MGSTTNAKIIMHIATTFKTANDSNMGIILLVYEKINTPFLIITEIKKIIKLKLKQNKNPLLKISSNGLWATYQGLM